MSFGETQNLLSSRRVQPYYVYYSKVAAKRLKYYSHVSILLAILVSISLHIPFGNFWWNILLTAIIRGPVLLIALLLIRLMRNLNLTVDYSRLKTFGSHLLRVLTSREFFISFGFLAASGILIATLYIFQLSLKDNYYFLSKEYQKKPVINDEWVYYWFYVIFASFVYAAQHFIFQRNRLSFYYGISKMRPEDGLFKYLPKVFGASFILNTFTAICGPLAYLFVRSIIYKSCWVLIAILGLDQNVPRYSISVKGFSQNTYLSGHLFFSWELMNYVYNVYATIGCLDGKKPISAYSSDPVNTLLLGLRDVDPKHSVARLSAFQELAYIATTKEPEGAKVRHAVYNARSKAGFIWPAILYECTLIIKETTDRINYRSRHDREAWKRKEISVKEEYKTSLEVNDEIFGNSVTSSPIRNGDFGLASITKYDQYKERFGDDQASRKGRASQGFYNNALLSLVTSLKSLIDSHNQAIKKSHITLHFQKFFKEMTAFYQKCYDDLLESNFGVFFRITLKRDTESRVVNPVNYGNSVIAVSNLIMHAVEEDKTRTITSNHISEILVSLERAISACTFYTEFPPSSIYRPMNLNLDSRKLNNNLIALLHDLTLDEFFSICMKYNYKLNDLVLPPKTFKLAKWVIDVAIAQQQKQRKDNKSAIII